MPTLNWDRCLEYALLLIHSVANLCGFCVDVFLQPLRPHPWKQNGLAEDNQLQYPVWTKHLKNYHVSVLAFVESCMNQRLKEILHQGRINTHA